MSQTEHQALLDTIRKECKQQGIALDQYDPDFIVGVIIEHCHRHQIAITGTGIRRYWVGD